MVRAFISTLLKVRNLFFIVASSIRESEENLNYVLLSSEKLRYFDFTTRLHRLATTNSSVSSVPFWFQQRRGIYFRV